MRPHQERRYNRRQIESVRRLPEELRYWRGVELLIQWRAEACRRADDLGAPAVWALMDAKSELIRLCDPKGELVEELRTICQEAVARVARPLCHGRKTSACSSVATVRSH